MKNIDIYIFGLLSYVFGVPLTMFVSLIISLFNSWNNYKFFGLLLVMYQFIYGLSGLFSMFALCMLFWFIRNNNSIIEKYKSIKSIVKATIKLSKDMNSTEIAEEINNVEYLVGITDNIELKINNFVSYFNSTINPIKCKIENNDMLININNIKNIADKYAIIITEEFVKPNCLFIFNLIKKEKHIGYLCNTYNKYTDISNHQPIELSAPSQDIFTEIKQMNDMMKNIDTVQNIDITDLNKMFLNMDNMMKDVMQVPTITNKKKKKKKNKKKNIQKAE